MQRREFNKGAVTSAGADTVRPGGLRWGRRRDSGAPAPRQRPPSVRRLRRPPGPGTGPARDPAGSPRRPHRRRRRRPSSPPSAPISRAWSGPSRRALRPGTVPNMDFTVPRAADVRWLAANGYGKNRLPFMWELLQPMLDDTVANAQARAAHRRARRLARRLCGASSQGARRACGRRRQVHPRLPQLLPLPGLPVPGRRLGDRPHDGQRPAAQAVHRRSFAGVHAHLRHRPGATLQARGFRRLLDPRRDALEGPPRLRRLRPDERAARHAAARADRRLR